MVAQFTMRCRSMRSTASGIHHGNPADFFVEVCFGMVEPSNGMTDAVEKLGELA